MALTLEQYQEMAALAQELGDVDAEIEAREGIQGLKGESYSIGESILGGVEAAGVMAGGAIAEPIAGLAGLAAAAYPGGESGADAVNRVREELSIKPESGAASAHLSALGESFKPVISAARSPVAGLSGIASLATDGLDDAVSSINRVKRDGVGAELGDAVMSATGNPELAAIAHTIPAAALEALGVKAYLSRGDIASAASKASESASSAVNKAVDATPAIPPLTKGGRAKERIKALIEDGSSDIETARYSIPSPSGERGAFRKLGEKLRIGAPDVVKDSAAVEAIRQGFDEGVIAAIKASSPADKAKMAKMVDVAQAGKKNKRVSMVSRATDVVGDSLVERLNVIKSANKQAAANINKAAKSLEGTPVDLTEAVTDFSSSLDDLGVQLVRDGGGGFKPNFEFSQLSPGDRGPIKEVIRQMNIRGSGGVDALDAHKMKRIIDNNVTFGKSKTGISGDAERALKSFRAGLDEILDSEFPSYNNANTAYSETIQALDAIQDVAGRKMDLFGPRANSASGTLLRRVMSNAQSRVNLVDALDQIEGIANKYKMGIGDPDGVLMIEEAGRKSIKAFDDDLLSQILFADELDSVFKPAARTSLEGAFSRQMDRAADAATTSGRGNLAFEAAGKAAEKVRGINEDNAFKAIKTLLKSE